LHLLLFLQPAGAFDLLRWISHRYGFGTYSHHIPGYLSNATRQAREALSRLVGLTEASNSNVYVDTLVSPSYTTAICQLIQIPGISGKENNMVLFEFSKEARGELEDIVDNFQLVSSMGFDVAILASSERGFGYRRQIHVWLSTASYDSASLMVVLAYILIGHPDWKRSVIRIHSILPEDKLDLEKERLHRLIRTGRLPISPKNVEVIPQQHGRSTRSIVAERSRDADLVIVGFHADALRHEKSRLFEGYEDLGNVLFVHSEREILLARKTTSSRRRKKAKKSPPRGGQGAPRESD
jgi:hypothetical protein